MGLGSRHSIGNQNTSEKVQIYSILSHLLLLSCDLSVHCLLQTPGGGQVGRGGGGMEGKGGNVLLPLQEPPGPEIGVEGGVWCWKVL